MSDTALTSAADLTAGDFRDLIRRKLAAKESQLGQTEESIKKYVAVLPPSSNTSAAPQRVAMARFQNRLGPPAAGAAASAAAGGYHQQQDNRAPMRARLGPRVDEEEDNWAPPQARGGLLSRVVVEQKSRDEVLAEKKATENKKETQRNRRMFGNLMGTLQKFRQDENRVKDKEQKKREIEKKIEEKTEKEREEARSMKRELFHEKRKQQHEIKVLQVR
jgi:hypothetical protein